MPVAPLVTICGHATLLVVAFYTVSAVQAAKMWLDDSGDPDFYLGNHIRVYRWSQQVFYHLFFSRLQVTINPLVIMTSAKTYRARGGHTVGRSNLFYFPSLTRAMEAFRDVYQMPWTRASPWLFGVMTSFILIRKSIPPSRVILCRKGKRRETNNITLRKNCWFALRRNYLYFRP